jgi:hypothetical protein
MLWLPRKIRRFLLLHDLPVWFKNRIADLDDGWWESQESGPAKEKLEQRYASIRRGLAACWWKTVAIVAGGLMLYYLKNKFGL